MIRVQGLNKTIQDKVILQDIDVEIRKGRLTSMIGPNGAGKSTLLSAITRLIDFEEGTIDIEGKAITDYKSNDLAKKLSILKQSNHTELNITVEELVKRGYLRSIPPCPSGNGKYVIHPEPNLPFERRVTCHAK